MSDITKDDLKLTDTLGKAQENYPTLDFVKGLKSAQLTKRNGTKVEYKITDKKDLQAFADARKKAMRMEMDAGMEHQSRQRRVKMRMKDQVREIPEKFEDELGRAGKAKSVMRLKPTTIYRDGRWWVKQGSNWVPED